MTTFTYSLTGKIVAPDGSKLNEFGTGIVLPDGRELKLWEAAEINNGEDYEDLSYAECEKLGIHWDGDPCDILED